MIIFKKIADSEQKELRYHTLTREEVYTTSSMMASLDNKEVKICAIVNIISSLYILIIFLYIFHLGQLVQGGVPIIPNVKIL